MRVAAWRRGRFSAGWTSPGVAGQPGGTPARCWPARCSGRTRRQSGAARRPGRRWRGVRRRLPVRPDPRPPGPRPVGAGRPAASPVYPPPPKASSSSAAMSGSAKSVSAGALTNEEPGRPRRISVMRWRTRRVLTPAEATCSWLGKAYPLAAVSGSNSAAAMQVREIWTLTVISSSC